MGFPKAIHIYVLANVGRGILSCFLTFYCYYNLLIFAVFKININIHRLDVIIVFKISMCRPSAGFLKFAFCLISQNVCVPPRLLIT